MRTILMICGVLFLAACGTVDQVAEKDAGKKDAGKKGVDQKGGPLTNDDSSPIIISDGSVKLHQPDVFRIHRKQDGAATPGGPVLPAATVKLRGHAPTSLAYLCDPGTPVAPGPCLATVCKAAPGVNNAACGVDLTTLTSWMLELSDSTGVVSKLKWDNGNTERIAVHAPNGYKVEGAGEGNTTSGVSLLPSTNVLTAAKLTVNGGGTVYKFTCTAGQDCVTVGYYCPASAASCQ